LGRVWERKGTELRAKSLVVIALAFSVNGTAPRRPAAGFAATARSAARIFQGRRAGAQSHCTVSPTSSVLSPKLALHPKSTIQILNPPKISKFAPTTTVTSHSRIHHFHHFQPQQQRLNSATSSSFITFQLSIATMSSPICLHMLMSTRCRPNNSLVP
jgi:hypothetical protein